MARSRPLGFLANSTPEIIFGQPPGHRRGSLLARRFGFLPWRRRSPAGRSESADHERATERLISSPPPWLAPRRRRLPRRGAPMSGGSAAGADGANLEADLLERRIELRIEPPERLAHLRGPAVEDSELDRLLPAALVGLEALLLDRHDERVDLLLVGLLVGVREVRRRRRVAQRRREGLVGMADLVERGGRPFGHPHAHAVEEGGRPPASSSSAFCFSRAESFFMSPLISICSNAARMRSPCM